MLSQAHHSPPPSMNERRRRQQSENHNHDDDLSSHSIPSHHHDASSSATSNASITSSTSDGNGNSYYHQDDHKRQRCNHRKSVQFAPTAELYMLPTPMSTQEETSYWYTEQDDVNSKIEMSYCSRVLRQSDCLNVVENIAHHIATNITSDVADDSSSSTSSLNDESCRSIDTFKHQLQPHERLLTRGIEHTISPTVLKLINHGRDAVVLRVLREQARLRQQLQYEQQRRGSSISGAQVQWRMSMALAQVSRESTLFAREWAVHKLMDE